MVSFGMENLSLVALAPPTSGPAEPGDAAPARLPAPQELAAWRTALASTGRSPVLLRGEARTDAEPLAEQSADLAPDADAPLSGLAGFPLRVAEDAPDPGSPAPSETLGGERSPSTSRGSAALIGAAGPRETGLGMPHQPSGALPTATMPTSTVQPPDDPVSSFAPERMTRAQPITASPVDPAAAAQDGIPLSPHHVSPPAAAPGGPAGPTAVEASFDKAAPPAARALASPAASGIDPSVQIARAIGSPSAGETIEVRLDPPELGRVRIAFEFGDAPRAVVSASQPETLDLLRRGGALLTEELAQAGLSEAEIEWSEQGLPDDRDEADAAPVRHAPGPDTTDAPPRARHHDGALDRLL